MNTQEKLELRSLFEQIANETDPQTLRNLTGELSRWARNRDRTNINEMLYELEDLALIPVTKAYLETCSFIGATPCLNLKWFVWFHDRLQPIDPPENSDAAALKMALELPYSDDDPAIMESFYRHSLSYMALQNDEDRAQWVGQLRLSSVSDLIRAVEFLRTYDGGISCTLEQQRYYEILNFVFGCDLDVEPDDCFMLITAYHGELLYYKYEYIDELLSGGYLPPLEIESEI